MIPKEMKYNLLYGGVRGDVQDYGLEISADDILLLFLLSLEKKENMYITLENYYQCVDY